MQQRHRILEQSQNLLIRDQQQTAVGKIAIQSGNRNIRADKVHLLQGVVEN